MVKGEKREEIEQKWERIVRVGVKRGEKAVKNKGNLE